jgi:pimeloyl-ACP methyl ester carboxylesterase
VADGRGGGDAFCAATSDGWLLQGAMWNIGNASAPGALLVHGLNEDRHSYDALANGLAAKGWRVVAFDARGHGLSTHRTDGTTRALAQFGDADLLAMERDLDAMQPIANATVLVGASVGANEALRFAAGDPNVTAVALLSAGDSYRGLDATGAASRFGGSILFLASQDDSYAAQSARDLAARHPGAHEVDVIAGSAHGTNLLQDPTVLGALEAWVGRQARPS